MAETTSIKGWLRISKVAERSGVPAATIKYYVQEGLLPPPVKTGKTMAYYDPACIERIQWIKRLQRERFLPLSVIRRLMESGNIALEEVELGDTLTRTYLRSSDERSYTEKQIRERTGLSRKKILALESNQLISPGRRKGRKAYDASDLGAARYIAAREKLGLPFDFSLETMQIYHDALSGAVRQDVRRFLRQIMQQVPESKAVDIIREADAGLDRYVIQARRKILSSLIGRALEEINQLGSKLQEYIFIRVPGAYLPKKVESSPDLYLLQLIFSGRYDQIVASRELEFSGESPNLLQTTVILALLFLGRIDEATHQVEAHPPGREDSVLELLTAGITLVYAAARAPGFMEPIQRSHRAIEFIHHAEAKIKGGGPISLFVRYVCGVIYFWLPEVLGFRQHGLGLLESVHRSLRKGVPGADRFPPWLARTLCRELFPQIQIHLRGILHPETLRGN